MPCAGEVHRGEVEHCDRVRGADNLSQLNRQVMLIIFFPAMLCIGLFEALFDPNHNVWLRDWVNDTIASEDSADARDPKVTGKDAERGLVITKVPFAELIKEFPRTTVVCAHT